MSSPSPKSKPQEFPIEDHFDLVVVGAGFGGLGCALRAQELGRKVLICEALNYPGGCASTFSRGGRRFESGATLFSGLGHAQLFHRWIEKYALDVQVEWPDPIVTWRQPGIEVNVTPSREALVESFLQMPGAPQAAIRKFFRRQEKVAKVLWRVLGDADLIPPLGLKSLLRHSGKAFSYAALLPLVGQPLSKLMAKDGVLEFAPLKSWVDSVCQITLQCPSDEVEAIFALGTLDYFWQGTGHVRDGIGALANGLLDAIVQAGGVVSLPNRVKSFAREPDGRLRVETRRGVVRTRNIAFNLLPAAVARMAKDSSVISARGQGRLHALEAELQSGWGACMLYVTLDGRRLSGQGAHHIEVVQDPSQALIEGNHFFCSLSSSHDRNRGRESFERTATISTHMPMHRLLALTPVERGPYVADVQDCMRRGLRHHVPEWEAALIDVMTASPRTFERFTGRPQGFVGGIPRRAGWHNYKGLSSPKLGEGLHLVGDSVFPGQSTLATALGGVKVAERLPK